jgi:multidrug resistance efflux pump
MADENRLEQLAADVEAIGQTVTKLTNSLPDLMKEAMKPATDLVANMQAETEARDAAELATLTAELVNAGFINEDKTDTLTLDVARALAEKLAKEKRRKDGQCSRQRRARRRVRGLQPQLAC